jgi:hypothetical protein
MHKPTTAAELIALFGLDDAQLERREKVGAYIHSFGTLIAERMYNNYLLKDSLFRNYLSFSDTSRLIRMFGEYFSSLFIHPFDERLIERTQQIAEIHMAIGLEAIQVSRGFDILSEIIIDLAGVNAHVREDLAIILKMLRICESIMTQSYLDRFTKRKNDLNQENKVISLFDALYKALTIHKRSQQKLTHYWENPDSSLEEPFNSEEMCPFTHTLDNLEDEREFLMGFGINLDEVRMLHRDYHEKLETLLSLERSDGESIYTS